MKQVKLNIYVSDVAGRNMITHFDLDPKSEPCVTLDLFTDFDSRQRPQFVRFVKLNDKGVHAVRLDSIVRYDISNVTSDIQVISLYIKDAHVNE